MSKKYLAYALLVCTTLIWSVNFIIGKFAYLFEVPPLTLNFLRWSLVWVLLFPFTYKEIFLNSVSGFLLAILATILISIISWFLIEKPSMKFKKNQLRKHSISKVFD